MQINGAELSYVAGGEGEPVGFVHGSVGDYRDWLDVLGPFAARYRVVAVSRRGHFPNAWPEDDRQCLPEIHAADLAALIEALELGPVHLFGHSYGGVVALVMACQRPDLIRTLALGEPPLFRWLVHSDESRALYDAFQVNGLEPARRAFAAGNAEGAVRAFLESVIGEGTFDRLPPPVYAAIMDNAGTLRVEVGTPLESLLSALTPEDVARLTMPVLLVQGELTPPMFPAVLAEIARCLPHAERATIPGVSHDLYNPPAFQEALLGFMGRH